jgi:hypothetical protein
MDLETRIEELDCKKKTLTDAVMKAKVGKEESVSCAEFLVFCQFVCSKKCIQNDNIFL